jgi:hypothetical protein
VSSPVRVRVRMYQVGFGDCFLVSVEYDEPLADGRAERHLLIDFGSTRKAREGRAPGKMSDVAKLIQKHTGGVLDVLVVTHRHKDHLFGFADDDAAKILRVLAPKRVLRPWTEDPELPALADAPAGAGLAADDDTGRASARYAQLLADAQREAEVLSSLVGLHKDVRAEALEQVKNADAIALIDELAADGRGRYLHAGADAAVEQVIPGLGVTVLGPPTVEQDPRVAKQREEDPEYWMAALHASLREAARTVPGEDGHETHGMSLGPGPVRWVVERLAAQKSHSVARLVRDLDDALNNTSLVLLLEIGGVSMLFPGDAQIENWQYTLDRICTEPDLKAKLSAIDLYKVGHHGSRNATPRALHALWAERDDELPPLTALMSTREGVHGKTEATAVPRATLVTGLGQVATLLSTDDLDNGDEFLEVVSNVARGPFIRVGA